MSGVKTKLINFYNVNQNLLKCIDQLNLYETQDNKNVVSMSYRNWTDDIKMLP